MNGTRLLSIQIHMQGHQGLPVDQIQIPGLSINRQGRGFELRDSSGDEPKVATVDDVALVLKRCRETTLRALSSEGGRSFFFPADHWPALSCETMPIASPERAGRKLFGVRGHYTN